ncbi:type VII secretion protein EccCa [Luedemannella helvata]|uniref:Type VII secretion protein EccC n=1 Tax=Luedemannella helvata TaxID=349315 RepID=A0ABP4VY59_9ACTN
MTTVIVKRPQRRPEPPYPSGEILLESPPELPKPTGRAWGQMMMMLPMLAGSVAMALMFAGQRGGTFAYITGGLFGLSTIGMLASQFGQHAGGASKQEMLQARQEYLRHLAQQRRRAQTAAKAQRRTLLYRHPHPQALWTVAESPRVWERRSGDGDFLTVRIGLGQAELATPLVPPQSKPLEDLEPMCALALRRFLTAYTNVDDLPLIMALDGFSRVYVRGDRDRVADLARAVLAQVSAFHAPDDVLVAVCAAPERRPAWEWVKWLPHGLHPTKVDAVGELRLVATTLTGLEAMLEDVLAGRPRFGPSAATSHPHLVVVADGGDTAGSDHLMTDGGMEGVTVLDLDGTPPRVLDRSTLVLEIAEDGQLHAITYEGRNVLGRPDALSQAEMETLAMGLAPMRPSLVARGDNAVASRDMGFAELLELGDPETFELARMWAPRPNRDRLRVPIGLAQDGTPVELDLKESAQDGMGPHGLLIGATGSGKSELLRTLVLALAATHSSEVLNFVLVDFKGGASFARLDKLPHTSALITNLSDELALVDRMTDAINGELIRRQELLRRAGNYASARDYERARTAGAPLDPLPSLLIICDEFSELLTAKPDFIDMFVQIGRVGRSLGIHLLLASQRLEEGRLRGLDTHLSYRIGLRTFSAMESRVVLGDIAAYELPRSPGHGYLRFGTEPMIRFRAAYVSGRYQRAHTPLISAVAGDEVHIEEYTTAYVPLPAQPAADKPEQPEPEETPEGESLLDVIVARLIGQGMPAHQVWLAPLKEAVPLNDVLPPLISDPARGVTVSAGELHGALRVPVGVVDKPLEQRRDGLWLDLAGAGGHAVVVGGPQSGKSTFMRTLVVGLALTHTPREVQVYCLDFGGGSLSAVRQLPHVGSVATRLDPGLVRRTIAELRQLLTERERRFADHGIDSMASYRRRRNAGEFADDPFGDVFLIVDGWTTIRSDFEDLESHLTEIVTRGLSFGVHVVVSAAQWMDLRPAVRDSFGTRLELRLGDPAGSALDRRAAHNVPRKAPGRGITAEKLQFLTALPRVDGLNSEEDLAASLSSLATDVSKFWTGPGAPPVRLLPTTLPYANLPVRAERSGVPIGIAELDLAPVWLDFATDPHALVFGDSECGKSTFLRSVARAITDRYSLTEARIITVDYRRSLLGAVTTDHQIGYGTSAPVTENIIREVAGVMRSRLPGPDVTAEQLRDRSWWKGPDLYVLVDDYDLVAAGGTNPLTPLVEFLGQARDIGLHLIVTRRSGGASRALYDPVIMRLRELGSSGIVMAGDKNEGILLGNVKPGPQPPGRGWLVTRREGARLVQLAWLAPPE